MESASVAVLVVRTALGRVCALPLAAVRETLRPLPVEPLPDLPPFVRGLSRIRGQAMPVIELGGLLDEAPSAPRRLVSLGAGARAFALAVDSVLGVQHLEPSALDALPPLLRSTRADVVQSIGYRDHELLLVLDSMRLLPAELWERLDVPSP